MTNQEFSNSFQTLVNSYMRFRDFDDKEPRDTIEFDEYEKSLYLSKAQEELILSFYNGKNPYNESFEKTEEVRRYLAPLILEVRIIPSDNPDTPNAYTYLYGDGSEEVIYIDEDTGDVYLIKNEDVMEIGTKQLFGMGKDSHFYMLPPDLWFITYESVLLKNAKCDAMSTVDVYPVTQDEYHKIKRNPFRGVSDRRALRLDLARNYIEIICKYDIKEYYARYIRKPKPIVLEEMPMGVSVNGETHATECELHDALHQRILELAVRMALQSKGYTINNENK